MLSGVNGPNALGEPDSGDRILCAPGLGRMAASLSSTWEAVSALEAYSEFLRRLARARRPNTHVIRAFVQRTQHSDTPIVQHLSFSIRQRSHAPRIESCGLSGLAVCIVGLGSVVLIDRGYVLSAEVLGSVWRFIVSLGQLQRMIRGQVESRKYNAMRCNNTVQICRKLMDTDVPNGCT